MELNHEEEMYEIYTGDLQSIENSQAGIWGG